MPALDANGCPAARLCYMHYHPARREVLCAARWSFAQKLVSLASGLAESDSVHSFPYMLPQDCLRVLSVNAPHWTLRGRYVYCTRPEIRLLYIADTEDTELFEPLFTEALATRLAAKMCIPLISSTTARQALTDEYNRMVLPQAAYVNAVQDRSNDSHPLYRLFRSSFCSEDDLD